MRGLESIGMQPWYSVTLKRALGEESDGVGALTTLVKGIRAAHAIIMDRQSSISGQFRVALAFALRTEHPRQHEKPPREGDRDVLSHFKALEKVDTKRHARYQNQLFEFSANVARIGIGTLRFLETGPLRARRTHRGRPLRDFPEREPSQARVELLFPLDRVVLYQHRSGHRVIVDVNAATALTYYPHTAVFRRGVLA